MIADVDATRDHRYTEMVWEAGLVGRELSRHTAKACFVNALAVGDALAGVTEFVEVVARLAHKLTPMTREERVGAPPPPMKKFAGHQNTLGAGGGGKGGGGKAASGPAMPFADPKLNKHAKGTKGGAGAGATAALGAQAPPLPPPLLERSTDGLTMCFTPAAEAQLLSKLDLVLGKLAKVAHEPGDDAPSEQPKQANKPGRPVRAPSAVYA